MADYVKFNRSKTTAQAQAGDADVNAIHFTTDEQIVLNKKIVGNVVKSVAGKTGTVTLAKADVGLGNVTNESKETMFTSPALTGTPTAPTAASGTNTTQIATTAFVATAVSEGIATSDAMTYKGALNKSNQYGETGSYISPAANKGDTYKIATAGAYGNNYVEVGDMVICNTDDTPSYTPTSSSAVGNIDTYWDIIQRNLDGAVIGPTSSVENHVATFASGTGKTIKDSGYTIAKSVPSDAVFTDTDTKVTSVGNHYTPSTSDNTTKSVTSGALTVDSYVITGVTIDAAGHVTGVTGGKLPDLRPVWE